MTEDTKPEKRDDLAEELANFQEIARRLKPGGGELPRLEGVEICGVSLRVGGIPSLAEFAFLHEEERVLTTLFVQLMLDRGYLAFTQFKPSYAHTAEHVGRYLHAVSEVFEQIRKAIDSGAPETLLESDPARKGFYRLI